MNFRSLRLRLTTWHACVLTAVFVSFGTVLFVQLKHYLEATILNTQARRAQQIGETLLSDPAQAAGDAMPSATARIEREIESLYAPELSDRFIRITRRDGTTLYLSGAPRGAGFDPARVPRPTDWPTGPQVRKQAVPGAHSLLIAAFPTRSPSTSETLVEVGTSAEPVDTLLARLAVLLGLGLPIVVLAAVGGGYILVGSALRPVDAIAAKATLITQHSLSERLPVVRTGDELERLADSLNHMISRLDEAFQSSKRFVADASHELRTPLTILQAELENLAQDPGASPAFADRIGSLLEETARLSKIVEQLLALSRLDAGEARKETLQVDLAALAAGTADQMALLAEDRKITLTHSSSGEVLVVGDRAKLKQVIVNLLDNAITYTPSGGTVRIEATESGVWSILEVADSGIGISAEAVPHVFERFFRADPARPRHPDGAGLGLAIVRSICTAHGGQVEVESTPGKGSRFRIRLPRPGAAKG
jgi:heavy metal sensor kinase